MSLNPCKIIAAATTCLMLGMFSCYTQGETGSRTGSEKRAGPRWDHADESLPKISVPQFEGKRYEE